MNRRSGSRIALLAVAAVAAALTGCGSSGHGRPAGTPTRSGTATGADRIASVGDQPASKWGMAAVDATDRRLTIRLQSLGRRYTGNSAGGCRGIARSTVREHPDRVVVAVSTTYLSDCDTGTRDTTVTLSAPLGDRPVIDGYDAASRPVLHLRDLPVPSYPPGLAAVPSSGSSRGWVVGYTRPGGPDVNVRCSLAALESPSPSGPAEGVTVHGHRMVVYQVPSSYRASWDVDQWQFLVAASPREGGAVSRTEFQRILDGLRWS